MEALKRSLESLFAWSFFPLTLGASLWLAHRLWLAGWAPGSIIGVASLLAIGIIVSCEYLQPFRRDWSRSQNDVLTDVAHNFITSYALREWLKIGFAAAIIPWLGTLSAAVGLQVWPQHWPMALQVVLAAVAAEFGNYWLHRLSHEHDFLWRFHSVHHSPGRIYWLNAGRDHPLGMVIDYSAGAVPLIILGVPVEVAVYFYVFESVMGLVQHANVRHRMGLLNYIFSSADLHRWHHSNVITEANNNYGSSLIIWDLLFGTFFNPPDRCGPTTIGLADMPDFPQRFWTQWLVPFRWRSLRRGSASALSPST